MLPLFASRTSVIKLTFQWLEITSSSLSVKGATSVWGPLLIKVKNKKTLLLAFRDWRFVLCIIAWYITVTLGSMRENGWACKRAKDYTQVGAEPIESLAHAQTSVARIARPHHHPPPRGASYTVQQGRYSSVIY